MIRNMHRDIARSSLLMRSLSDEHVDRFLAHASIKRLDRGETLFLQGEPATSVHVVAEGWIKLYRIAPNGGEAVVSVFAKGESFGEAVALQNHPYPVSAEAVTGAELIQIPASVMVDMMKREPDICVKLLSSIFTHLHSLVAQLEQLKAQTGPQRVAEFLASLCPQTSGPATVTLPYDKVLIAGRLGMKPESLSRAFAKLRDLGVKVNRSNADIADIAKLKTYAETDPAESWARGG